ncbi:MAG: MFS transporter, partial [Clostridia bacterium]|nr:MFS transporter [Clostridia bacterium]
GELIVNIFDTDSLKRSRFMYILEAAFEYLISILVAGSFLATITKELGMSDSLTGILSSVISLGCLFQLFSVLFRKNSVKGFVIILSVVNQLLFMLLYIIPLSGAGKQIKTALFIIVIFSAYLIYYIAHPKKINWLMSVVEDKHRGIFTANKEIVSLICGMAFSFGMGALVDHFAEKGEIRIAFILCALVIFILTVMHTLTMTFAVEKPMPQIKKRSLLANVKDVAGNKNVIQVSVIFGFYYIATYISTPFYGAYQINELQLSLKLVSILVIMSSITRILVSKMWGKYADKYSFAAMIEKCFIIIGLAYLCAAFAIPSQGKIMFALYYILHGVAMGGINSALINLIFDYVDVEKRSDSLAICQAAAGLLGFLATLVSSGFVKYIQNNGNEIFGITLYSQQILSFLSLVFTVVSIIYIRTVIMKKNKQ